MKTKETNQSGVSIEQIERVARCLLPDITEFFSNPEWQQEVALWTQPTIT